MIVTEEQIRDEVVGAIKEHRVMLFMKGVPEAPRCGFSMRAVGILEQMGTEYGAIDVLPVLQPLREVTAEMSDWQTFPQLYVDGELLGGADLMEEMLESGELAETLGVPQPQVPAAEEAPAEDERPYQSPPMQIET